MKQPLKKNSGAFLIHLIVYANIADDFSKKEISGQQISHHVNPHRLKTSTYARAMQRAKKKQNMLDVPLRATHIQLR